MTHTNEQTVAPRCCQTCLHMATHEHCRSCNLDEYSNYQEGNWMKQIVRYQIEGRNCIVIGYQGEADLTTKQSPQDVAKHLHSIAEDCGYMCGRLTPQPNGARLRISTQDGYFEIVWDSTTWPGLRIYQLTSDWDGNETGRELSWPPFEEDVFNALAD